MISVKNYLEDNNLKVLDVNATEIVISYKFDLVEIDAARAFETELDDLNDLQKHEEYKQYLEDIAYDNVSEIVEEISEELDIDLVFTVAEQLDSEQLFIIKKDSNF